MRRSIPYVFVVIGAILMMAGFIQAPLGTVPTIWTWALLIIGALLLVGGCTLYWAWYERRPTVPAWDGPPRTIIPPVRSKR